MPKASSTQAKILQAGKQEFLEKGFKDASLRDIAAVAGVTTGAIYGYYPDKAALFAALVQPHADHLKTHFCAVQQDFVAQPEDRQIETMNVVSAEELPTMLDYVYQHLDAFRLLVLHSAGTEYEGYLESLVELETEGTVRFIEVLRHNGHTPVQMEQNLIHLLNRAYFSAVFETVAHDMPKQEADRYVGQITAFFIAGWSELLGIQ